MDESETRGRRRQLPQQEVQQLTYSSISASTNTSSNTLPFISQQRTKRKLSDHSIGLPKHLDFSYRDPSDATAKRRFQVKVPTKILIVLALVFLFIPGLIFLHKEMHIHEDHYESHFKTEKYIHVNTDEVFSKFRFATNQTDTTTTIQHHDDNDEEVEDTSTDTSSILNINAIDAVVINNHTISTISGSGSGSGDMDHVEGDETERDESKLENVMVPPDHDHDHDHDHELVSSSLSSTTEISSSKNTTNIEESHKMNDDDKNNIKAITNSTNNIPERRRR
jgi:hypothetical protein